MTKVDDLQRDIEKQQNAVDAINAQVQQAQDRGQDDQVPGLMSKLNEHTTQIQHLNNEVLKAQAELVEQEKEEARKEQEEKDKDFSGGFLGL